jgi:predicted ATPase/transcriptional regulator with XRE-family HTH domain/Tfp pilus assembly protein PilF
MARDIPTFGTSLKQSRKALDMTQGELAALASCSPKMIAKIESGERRPSRQLADLLAEVLEVAEGDRAEFIRLARGVTGPIRRAEVPERSLHPAPAPEPAQMAPPDNLPVSPTEFIGRERQIVEAVALLRRPYVRLATLTGPGGVGKSRLCVEIARELLDHFPDGAFFVALGSIRSPALVVPAISRTLGVDEAKERPIFEVLKGWLGSKRVLLLLDNFEQVIGAAPLLAELLASCPHLKMLVTSREVLHLRGEKELAVPPMSLPKEGQQITAQTLMLSDAAKLFVERVQDFRPDYAPCQADAAATAAICARLDGLPLAIELAAARSRFVSLVELLLQLNRPLEAASGPLRDLPARQRTLRDTIQWSFDLLNEDEQCLFRHLAVFVGGASLEAVQAVHSTEGTTRQEILRGLESLVDKNLLRYAFDRAEAGKPRFDMLQTIHEYALEKLWESAEEREIARRHALYFAALAEKAGPELKGPDQAKWLRLLDEEHDNLRAALRWSEQSAEGTRPPEAVEAAETGLRLAGSLWGFWNTRGYYNEGRDHLSKALQAARTLGAGMDGVYMARALSGAGNLAMLQGDIDVARTLQEESLEVSRRIGDKRGMAAAFSELGRIAWQQGDIMAARPMYEESLHLAREINDKGTIAAALGNLGVVAVRRGEHALARAYYEESLQIKRQAGDMRFVALLLMNLGNVAVAEGDYASARRYYAESASVSRELGDKSITGRVLSNLGALAWYEGDYASAYAPLEESLVLTQETGEKLTTAASLSTLGNVAFAQGRRIEARSFYVNSLTISAKVGGQHEIATNLVGLAQVEAAEAQESESEQLRAEKAAMLLGAVEALCRSLGAVMDRDTNLVYEHGLALVRLQLEEAELERLRARGGSLSLDMATGYALE